MSLEILKNNLEIKLTDGVITLRPFKPEDAETHLAGDDEEQQKWLNDGHPSTPESVSKWIEKTREEWKTNGKRLAFAIVSNEGQKVVGMIEAYLDHTRIKGAEKGDVNISYGIYPDNRGQGYTTKAAKLVMGFLKEKGAKRAIIRVEPRNENSMRIPVSLGFTNTMTIEDSDGKLRVVFVKEL